MRKKKPEPTLEEVITKGVKDIHRKVMVTVNTIRNDYKSPERANDHLLNCANTFMQYQKSRLGGGEPGRHRTLFTMCLVHELIKEAEYTDNENGVSFDWALFEELVEVLKQTYLERREDNR